MVFHCGLICSSLMTNGIKVKIFQLTDKIPIYVVCLFLQRKALNSVFGFLFLFQEEFHSLVRSLKTEAADHSSL